MGWFTPTYKYAIYSCNADKNKVTMTTYDTDSTCSSDGIIDTVYTMNSFNQTGDLYSFNCGGTDNYAVSNVYEGDDSCCGDSYTVQNVATNVCYKKADDTIYHKIECNADGKALVYEYDSNDALAQCQNPQTSKNASDETNDSMCTLVASKAIKIYARMDKCIANGQVIGQSRFCVSTSASPTLPSMDPTNAPTLIPTIRPTNAPTVDTIAPTNSPTNIPTAMLDGDLFGGLSVLNAIIIGSSMLGFVLMSVAIYCCVRNVRMKRSFGGAGGDEEHMVGYYEYVEQMDKNEKEEEQVHMPLPESIAMEDVVTVGDQQIIGTADEINIIGADVR